jgi:hypothetical protein
MALVNDLTGEVIFAAELKHRGFAIRGGGLDEVNFYSYFNNFPDSLY